MGLRSGNVIARTTSRLRIVSPFYAIWTDMERENDKESVREVQIDTNVFEGNLELKTLSISDS